MGGTVNLAAAGNGKEGSGGKREEKRSEKRMEEGMEVRDGVERRKWERRKSKDNKKKEGMKENGREAWKAGRDWRSGN